MRFHVVALPHTLVTRDYSACAYTEKVRKFCNMMTDRGHTVFLYASGNKTDARCHEFISCLPEKTRAAYEATLDHYTAPSFDVSLPVWSKFNVTATVNIHARAKPRDFICLIAGSAQSSIARSAPELMSVEFGVGYHGTFSQYRVFESHSHMHAVYAAQAKSSDIDGVWFDAVIPNYFEVDDFPFREKKQDYFLFVGRMVDRKGLDVAIETCAAAGAKLVVAGPGTFPEGHKNVKYVGVVGPKERGKLMSRARALIAPTKYIEPFGGVVVEAALCGTPAITTDWGAFSETVEQGVTGFRCRTLKEFVEATSAVAQLDPQYIWSRAVSLYSTKVVGDLYVKHFNRLNQLWGDDGDGWYAGVKRG